MEPLATVESLEQYLLKMVWKIFMVFFFSLLLFYYFIFAQLYSHRPLKKSRNICLIFPQVAKQWYDFDRSSFIFVRKLREGQNFIFRHQHDFDENGIVYWIGTNAK